MKSLLSLILFALLLIPSVNARPIRVSTLVSGTVATIGVGIQPLVIERQFQAVGSTTVSTGSATILVQASQDNVNWVLLDTLSLVLGTAITSDTFYVSSPWKYVRGNLSAITGTGASASLYMGHKLELREE